MEFVLQYNNDDVLLLKVLKDHTAMLKSVGVKPSKRKDNQNSETLPNRLNKSCCHVLYKTQTKYCGHDYEKIKKMYDPLVPLLNTINEVT